MDEISQLHPAMVWSLVDLVSKQNASACLGEIFLAIPVAGASDNETAITHSAGFLFTQDLAQRNHPRPQ